MASARSYVFFDWGTYGGELLKDSPEPINSLHFLWAQETNGKSLVWTEASDS